ncbi:hypothetical protein ACFL0M_08595, partial [Thermodesulfobacteriota bacterium]
KRISYSINPKIWLGIKFLSTYINLRPGELISIKEGHIDFERGMIFIPVRNSGFTIVSFLRFMKSVCREHLETVTRNDVSAFIEHETGSPGCPLSSQSQDRDLASATISTHLRALYAFLNYLIEHDVVQPDVLKRKMHIKLW